MIKGFVELPTQVYLNGTNYTCQSLFSLDDIARVRECVDDYNYTNIVTKNGKVHTISLRYSQVVGKITDALEKRVQDNG